MTTSASLLSSCASACSITTNAWFSIAAVLPSSLCSSGRLETSTAMTRSAPDARATFTGTGLTSPPSTYSIPRIGVGWKTTGTLHEARTAMPASPRVKATSLPEASSVATATKGMSSCSIRRPSRALSM